MKLDQYKSDHIDLVYFQSLFLVLYESYESNDRQH